MTSQLNTKINSYTLKRGIECSEAFSLTPTRTGTSPLGTLTQNGTPNIVYAAAGPAYGSGSWALRAGSTATQSYVGVLSNAGNDEAESFVDGNYSTGFWFRFTVLPGGTGNPAYVLLRSSSTSGYGFQIYVTGTSATGGASKIGVISGAGTWTGTSPTLVTNQWYYVAFRRNGTSGELYLDGNLIITGSGLSGTSAVSTWTIGSNAPNSDTTTARMNFCNYYTTDYSTIDETAIGEIWLAGTTSGSTNISVSATPITAIASQTEPTIVIVNNDHVEITTSILVDAIMPGATVSVASNINYSSTALTASAEALDHTTILGTGILFQPQPITASADIVHPPFFGSGDVNVMPLSLTVSADIVNPTLAITPNYYNIVRGDNPSFFLINPTSPTLVNYGFDNWGTGSLQSSSIVTTSPGQFVVIGNGQSITQSSDAATSNTNFSFTSSAADTQADYFQLPNGGANDFTHEFWIYPRSYNGTSLEKVITMGSTEVLLSATQISLQLNSDEIANDGILEPYTHTVNATLSTGMWHHIVITGNYTGATALSTVIYHNSNVAGSKSFFHIKSLATDNGVVFNANVGDLYAYYNGIALYKYVLDYSDILAHYNFVATSSPNRIVASTPMESAATLVDPTFVITSNKNIPGDVLTASALEVNPSVLAAVGDGYDAELMIASATFVNPRFYGNPDAHITATVMTASVDTPQNVYRLDTAYYSYVQLNIAPIRYVTFDNPDPSKDWGSDNDFAAAAPFVYDGTITAANLGLNNNSLLSTGTDYTTSGLIMKESEWDDDWGTTAGSYHSSYWIKRHPDDIGSNGLRVIQSAYSNLDGSYGILYQHNNYLKMEMFNGTDYFTATSGFNVNVFDYAKHHIVVNFRKTGSNHFVDIYVDKQLAISVDVGTQSLIFKNSDSYWAPNTETNNKPRMSVGALIPALAVTSLPVTPTATKMYIDDVYWAPTSINQTGVNNLYAAMPYKQNITWTADTFLSNSSTLPMPTFGTGNTRTHTAQTASAIIVGPALTVDFDRHVTATTITATAQAIEPFSVIGDTITDINITSDILVASAAIGEHIVRITVPAQAMAATARLTESFPAWFDPYNILIIQESVLQVGSGTFGVFPIGDIDAS